MEPLDETTTEPLDRVAPRTAAPFPARDVHGEVCGRKLPEPHSRALLVDDLEPDPEETQPRLHHVSLAGELPEPAAFPAS